MIFEKDKVICRNFFYYHNILYFCILKQTMSYGVMVAQQILVLFVQVRILVRQHKYLNINSINNTQRNVGLIYHWSDIFL